MSATRCFEIAIIESGQREDLNAMEEAQSYHALASEFKRSQDNRRIVGRAAAVANTMRLTELPPRCRPHA
jgi:ParB family chromosome partitioning protein